MRSRAELRRRKSAENLLCYVGLSLPGEYEEGILGDLQEGGEREIWSHPSVGRWRRGADNEGEGLRVVREG